MNGYPKVVKDKLASLIAEMSESPAQFVRNPDKDFTRNRKLPFATVLEVLVSMGGGSIYKELCNRFYVDTCVQPGRGQNQHKALVEMVGRSPIKEKAIVIADRNYGCYNDFAHIERKGSNYVARLKDSGAKGILSGLRLPPDDEFDVRISRILTRKRTREVQSQPHVYRHVSSKATFDFLDLHTNPYLNALLSLDFVVY